MTLCNTSKPPSENPGQSWRRNVLHFAAVPRIIGRKNERRNSHDLRAHDDEKADGVSHCFHFHF